MRENVRNQTGVLLYNHRSAADFFVSMYTTAPDKLSFIGRLAVIFVFPVLFLVFYPIERNFILFYRAKKNKKKLKQRLLGGMLRLVRKGLFVVVFPEGHRNTEMTTLPLKRSDKLGL